ncbi:hypothetical protein KVM63_01000 [Helicobacter pylori]|nr:hypothetical protein [Helicobacter pylori]MCQ2825853.1 hypothetical protein [Helicobacter pylori]WRB09795.1 hypothetical protein KVM63_01000 [Helicobacter pylori]WRC11464.1 hypothetical protein KVC44_01035 [Helicobacter pylori]WRE51013.1 hypothetical protein KVD41_01010 [Helicobacter pylori]
MNGEFWRKGFIFNTNAFFADKNHQTNSSFSMASIHLSWSIRVGSCLTK